MLSMDLFCDTGHYAIDYWLWLHHHQDPCLYYYCTIHYSVSVCMQRVSILKLTTLSVVTNSGPQLTATRHPREWPINFAGSPTNFSSILEPFFCHRFRGLFCDYAGGYHWLANQAMAVFFFCSTLYIKRMSMTEREPYEGDIPLTTNHTMNPNEW